MYKYSYKIKSDTNGYLQLMNINSLLESVKGIDSKLIIYPHIGDFISLNEEIAILYYDEEQLKDDIEKDILTKLTLDDERLSFNDYRFSLQKIVDISLRALSPGINDPNKLYTV